MRLVHLPRKCPRRLENKRREVLMKTRIVMIACVVLSTAALAKLPALSDDAKVKAAEAAAKTAHGNKVADYQLCLSREKTAAHYFKTAKAAGKETKPATETPACADPGAFVYPPPAAPAAATNAAAPAAAPATTATAPATAAPAAAAAAPAAKK
jgi:hypothetical protein